jgi:ParB family chromosome partitioning protein
MTKSVKAMLAAKLAENQQRHAQAHQDTAFEAGRTHKNLSVDDIDPNPYQPRTIFPQAELDALASSISENGLLQPISVRPHGVRYQIIAGERRWRAHKLLGKRTIEVIVSEASDDDIAVAALAENIDRADLSDYEIGKAVRRVENLFKSKSRLAEALGMNRQDMYKYFAFDVLPGFVIERLDENPRLLSRAAAADIQAMLTRENGSAAALSALKVAVELVANKELDQSKITAFVSRTLLGQVVSKTLRTATRLKKDGLIIGSITRDSRNLVVKIKSQSLSDAQEAMLREFLTKLIDS